MNEESWKNLAGELRALAAEERDLAAPPAVEARLLAAFRAGETPVSAPPPRAAWHWSASWAALASAAAVLFVATGVWVGTHQRLAPRPAPQATQAGATNEIAAPATAEDTALASGFILLPSAERLGSNDDVNVVRLEVPRSAMLEVGIPVNPDRLSETVEADVLLGPDGLAHAVRFLN